MNNHLQNNKPSHIQAFVFVTLIGSSFLLALRLFLFIRENGVNLLFWDGWDFYRPLFSGNNNIWELFTWQHGLHRQGIGALIIKAIADLSHWNTIVDEYSIGITLCLTLVLLLYLKRRVFGPFQIADLIIPLTVINLIQYETIIGTPNISASALPLFLIICYCVSWVIKKEKVKYLFILIFNFLLIFTGYGLLIAPITLLLLGISFYHERKNHSNKLVKSLPTWTFLGSLLTIGLFFIDYQFQTGVTCFSLSWSFLQKYPQYISLMFAKFLRFDLLSEKSLTTIGGFIIVVILIIILSIQLLKILRRNLTPDSQTVVIFMLICYSLIFAISTAIGRVCLGINSSLSSRYTTLLIPAFIGLYFYLLTLKNHKSKIVATLILFLLLLPSLLPFTGKDQKTIEFYTTKKEIWKSCYLSTENYKLCNEETNFRIFPDDDQRIEKNLLFLKENHLNLYLDISP